MKKFFISAIATLCFMVAHAQNGIIELIFGVEIIKEVKSGNHLPKSPVRPPQATLDGHVLTFTTSHADYTLTLIDEDGEEAYVTLVPSDTDVVILPATLSGTYTLQLDFGGSYVFVSEIEL